MPLCQAAPPLTEPVRWMLRHPASDRRPRHCTEETDRQWSGVTVACDALLWLGGQRHGFDPRLVRARFTSFTSRHSPGRHSAAGAGGEEGRGVSARMTVSAVPGGRGGGVDGASVDDTPAEIRMTSAAGPLSRCIRPLYRHTGDVTTSVRSGWTPLTGPLLNFCCGSGQSDMRRHRCCSQLGGLGSITAIAYPIQNLHTERRRCQNTSLSRHLIHWNPALAKMFHVDKLHPWRCPSSFYLEEFITLGIRDAPSCRRFWLSAGGSRSVRRRLDPVFMARSPLVHDSPATV